MIKGSSVETDVSFKIYSKTKKIHDYDNKKMVENLWKSFSDYSRKTSYELDNRSLNITPIKSKNLNKKSENILKKLR